MTTARRSELLYLRARLRRIMLVSALVLLGSGSAQAELLGWDGTLTLDFLTSQPPLQHWELVGSHVAVSEASPPSLGALHVAGGISDVARVLVTDPETVGNSIAGVQVVATLGVGTLSPLPPLPFGQLLASRELPVFGAARLCLVTPSCFDNLLLFSLYRGPETGLGVGGVLTGSVPGGTRISIQAAPWTLGTASVPVETTQGGTATAFAFGFVHGPASATGTTGGVGGEVQLVTPMVALASGVSGPSGLSRLRLRFIPEPGRLALLAAGVLCLLSLAHRRTRPKEGPCRLDATRSANVSKPSRSSS
jgi:hypothetical protein